MSQYFSVELRRLLIEADNGLCAYCQSAEENIGDSLSIDHIIPASKDGPTEFENLCRACRRCNETKNDRVDGIDPVTRAKAPLYNPRMQQWDDHFQWDQTGTRIIGLTPTGRVTVLVLDMNNELIQFARRRWVAGGWHPPNQL
ncbi:MAG: HNH endonuclease [Chloroflexota bacterium]